MKKSILSLFILLSLGLKGQDWSFPSQYAFKAYFESAYLEFPVIPKGLLEAVAYTRTHISHLDYRTEMPSCSGLPPYFGPMGLVEDGKNYFRENLKEIARRSGYSTKLIQSSPEINIRAFASALAQLATERGADGSIESMIPLLTELSEIPLEPAGLNSFALDSYLFSVLKLFNSNEFHSALDIPHFTVDLEKVFGEKKLKILISEYLYIDEAGIYSKEGEVYEGELKMAGGPCYEFPGTSWSPADPSNYSSRGGTSISAVTIHTMQGYYAGTISWFQNPSANVSAHYIMRASDGQVTQMVCEADKAWHVGTENSYTVGIEHEGFVSDPSWYSELVYQKSAQLSRDICDDRGINPHRTYFKSSSSGVMTLGGCTKVKGHQHFPNQTHTDPGIHWNWEKYYKLLNFDVPYTISNMSSGTFYDTGGPSGNYNDDEHYVFVIDPPGTSSVTLDFQYFNLETDWDYLYVYDGPDIYSPIIGIYTGTAYPTTLTSASGGGAICIEFRSDCATTSPGWEIQWSSGVISCNAPSGTYTDNVTSGSARLNWNAVSGASYYQIKGRQAGGAWKTVNTSGTSNTYNVFKPGRNYEWKVKAFCGGSSSLFSSINTFTTLPFRLGNYDLVAEVYPNPANEEFFLKLESFPDKTCLLSMYDLIGRLYFQESYSAVPTSHKIDVSDLPAGTYFLRLSSGDHFQVLKLVIL